LPSVQARNVFATAVASIRRRSVLAYR